MHLWRANSSCKNENIHYLTSPTQCPVTEQVAVTASRVPGAAARDRASGAHAFTGMQQKPFKHIHVLVLSAPEVTWSDREWNESWGRHISQGRPLGSALQGESGSQALLGAGPTTLRRLSGGRGRLMAASSQGLQNWGLWLVEGHCLADVWVGASWPLSEDIGQPDAAAAARAPAPGTVAWGEPAA